MPHIAEIKEINGEIWVKVSPMNFGKEGGHGSITLFNETEIKQLRASVMAECIALLTESRDGLMKEIY